jgi:hypothetical protein
LLYCSQNQLSTLNVSSDNTELIFLDCNDNKFQATELDKIFTNLPDRSSMTDGGDINIYNNDGTNTCDRSIATRKKWTVEPPLSRRMQLKLILMKLM